MRINEIFNIRQYQVVEHERRGRVKRKGLQMNEVEMILDYGLLCFLQTQEEPEEVLQHQRHALLLQFTPSGIFETRSQLETKIAHQMVHLIYCPKFSPIITQSNLQTHSRVPDTKKTHRKHVTLIYFPQESGAKSNFSGRTRGKRMRAAKFKSKMLPALFNGRNNENDVTHEQNNKQKKFFPLNFV